MQFPHFVLIIPQAVMVISVAGIQRIVYANRLHQAAVIFPGTTVPFSRLRHAMEKGARQHSLVHLV